MKPGRVAHIFIAPEKGAPMQEVQSVEAAVGKGLKGDRCEFGKGRYQKGLASRRQVTLINLASISGTNFLPCETRRNIVTEGVELMTLIRKHFTVGPVRMRGVDYCDPQCGLPGTLVGKEGFAETFEERGGLIVEVWSEGIIRVGDEIALYVEPPREPFVQPEWNPKPFFP